MAEYKEMKYGKWEDENYRCSVCGYSLREIMDADSYFSSDFRGCNYCPNCGIPMKNFSSDLKTFIAENVEIKKCLGRVETVLEKQDCKRGASLNES